MGAYQGAVGQVRYHDGFLGLKGLDSRRGFLLLAQHPSLLRKPFTMPPVSGDPSQFSLLCLDEHDESMLCTQQVLGTHKKMMERGANIRGTSQIMKELVEGLVLLLLPALLSAMMSNVHHPDWCCPLKKCKRIERDHLLLLGSINSQLVGTVAAVSDNLLQPHQRLDKLAGEKDFGCLIDDFLL